MDASGKHPEQVPGNFWFVFFAYFLATAALYTAYGRVFISSRWRTVAETRKRGQRHLFVLSLGMSYLPVYAYFQAKSGDFKEVCLTLTVFVVAILHMLRIMLGLWQLHFFKCWAIRSMRTMESLGYRIELSSAEPASNTRSSAAAQEQVRDRAHFDADSFIVNGTIVGNRPLEGHAQCYLGFFSPKQKHTISSANSVLVRAVLKLFYAMEGALSFGRIVWKLPFARFPLYSNPNSNLFVRPRQPEELWLRWATVLISCAFPKWVADMRKSRSEESISQASEYQVHRDRFAEEILRSVALRCGRDTTLSSSNLLPIHLWRKFPKLSRGRFCKQEFLKYACTTGNGLPFQAPHNHAASMIEGDRIYSYAKYRSKLEETRDALPVNEGEKLSCLGIEELEWLCIFLSVGNWSIVSVDEGSDHENLNSVQPRKCDSSGIAIENLRNQLGFPGNVKDFSERLAGPFLKGTGATLWGNRNVLALSAHVDNWLALLAGEQVASVEQQVPGTEKGFLFRYLKEKESENRTQEPFGATEAIPEESIRLEKRRLMFQLADPEFPHFEQSLTFLGCSMENLRSHMAKWVESNPEEQCRAWTPTLGSTSSTAMNGGKFVFHASKDFEVCLSEVSSMACWSQRYLQMRLLWELQNKLQSTPSARGLSPNRTEAILLCILSFPAIRVIASEIERSPESDVCMQEDRHFCRIKIDEKPPLFHIEDCMLTLWASHGPQNVHVEVFFTRQVNESGFVLTAQLCADELEEGKQFVWEAWRDAFHRSLQSTHQWQVEHRIADSSLSVRQHIGSIGEGTYEIETVNCGIGPAMKLWKGWPPHRETLAKYEIMTDGLIFERKKTAMTPAKAGIVHWEGRPCVEHLCNQCVPVSYEEATGQYLTHASLIAFDSLRKAAGCSVDGNDTAIGKAMNKLICRNPNSEAIGRVAGLLERYFASEATKAPSVRILESLSRPVRKENWVQKITGHYRVLMTATSFDPIATISFASFCSALPSHRKDVMKEDGINALAISILRTTYSGNILLAFELVKRLEMLLGTGNEGCYYLACSMALNKIEHASKILSRTKNDVALTNTQHLRTGFMSFFGTFENSCGEENIPLIPGFKLELEEKKADAQNRLEQLFIEAGGCGVDDYACRAAEVYSQAADDGDLVSAYHLGFLFDFGVGVPLEESRAMELYTRAMNGGIDLAVSALAGLYACGRGVAKNSSYAVELYSRAIEKGGDTLTLYNFARLLQRGDEGVPVDQRRGLQLLSRAVEEGGDADTFLNLAYMHHTGCDGAPKDIPYAVRLYERAIKEGADHRAKMNLAQLLASGEDGVPVNLKRTAALYKSAVDENDDVEAMFKLGQLYLKGTGVPHDAVRATQLFQRAIDKDGDVDALVHFADVLIEGAIGVPQDPIRAVELYTRAIEEHGSGDAMFNLASVLEFGKSGLPSDSARAFSLYHRAASEKNHDGAARRLRKVEKQKQVLEQVTHRWSK